MINSIYFGHFVVKKIGRALTLHGLAISTVSSIWQGDWMAFRQRVGRLSRDGENSESVLMVGFADYVYAAIKAQLRRFDTIMPSDTMSASCHRPDM